MYPGRWQQIAALLVALICTLFVALPVATAADDAPADEADPELRAEDVFADDRGDDPGRESLTDEEAQQLAASMNRAFTAEEEERYEDARDSFLRSYSIYPHSNLLLSIARVSARLGNTERALAGYERFLERRPDFEERDKIEERIEVLEGELERESEVADGPVFSKLSMPSYIGWIGVATALVGTTGLVAGGLTASSIDGDFEALQQAEADGDRDRYIELSDDIESKQSRGRVFTYGGLGLVAAGAAVIALDYIYFDEPALFSPSAADAGLSVEPLVDGGAAVRWRSSF